LPSDEYAFTRQERHNTERYDISLLEQNNVIQNTLLSIPAP
jgi:hypothetical protein